MTDNTIEKQSAEDVITDSLIERAGIPFPQEVTYGILSELSKAGYVIVPVEPTDEMIDAGVRAERGPTLGSVVLYSYKAMIKAHGECDGMAELQQLGQEFDRDES